MTWAIVAAGASLVVFLVLSRYMHSARLRDWAALPTVRTRRHLAEVEDQIALDAQVVEDRKSTRLNSSH